MVKEITIYSTCQCHGISYYLKYYLPEANFNMIKNYSLVLSNQYTELENFRNILSNTNIFIYQEMPMKWGMYSTDLSVENNLLIYLPNNCIKIAIPYVFADWFWGIEKALLRDMTYNFDTICSETQDHFKYYNKNIILDLKYNKNYDLCSILQLYDDNQIDFKYEERIATGIKILKTKEKTCDIKISDYILENYKSKMLFYTPNHPSHFIFKEMSKSILEKLNIDCSNFDELTKNDNFTLSGRFIFSKYDKNFHKFEFPITCDDDYTKNIICEIYNLH
jgi:hypothetical protein